MPQHLPDEAADHIAGYTVGNAYGLHGFREARAGSISRVKCADRLTPFGPPAP